MSTGEPLTVKFYAYEDEETATVHYRAYLDGSEKGVSGIGDTPYLAAESLFDRLSERDSILEFLALLDADVAMHYFGIGSNVSVKSLALLLDLGYADVPTRNGMLDLSLCGTKES